jgi:hypothetical protein
MKRVLVLTLATSLSAACTPATRQKVGLGIVGVGAATTLVATGLLAPCLGDNTEWAGQPCADGAHTAVSNSKTGVPLLVGGLSVIIVGGMVIAGSMGGHASPAGPVATTATAVTAATPTPELKAATPVKLPYTLPANNDGAAPFPLDVKTACALAQRYLGGPVFSASGALIRFRVVSCRGPIRVAKDTAELVDVYLRAASTTEEEKLNVCFEHRAAWFVASAGTASCGSVFNR